MCVLTCGERCACAHRALFLRSCPPCLLKQSPAGNRGSQTLQSWLASERHEPSCLLSPALGSKCAEAHLAFYTSLWISVRSHACTASTWLTALPSAFSFSWLSHSSLIILWKQISEHRLSSDTTCYPIFLILGSNNSVPPNPSNTLLLGPMFHI